MILDDIVRYRKLQLEKEKNNISYEEIKKRACGIDTEIKDFYGALKRDKISVIAEVKKASPSKSVIREDFNPIQIALQYEQAGADAISCLTEEHYFQGSSTYLKDIAQAVKIPVLRKDFIIDEYQIYEARVLGASAILLIAAILDIDKLRYFQGVADCLGLQCLCEVHDSGELEKVLKTNAKIIGINNRNLKTFDVSLDTTAELAKKIGGDYIIVSESGIVNNNDMQRVHSCGADAVLIGETLMRSNNISDTMKELRRDIC